MQVARHTQTQKEMETPENNGKSQGVRSLGLHSADIALYRISMEMGKICSKGRSSSSLS